MKRSITPSGGQKSKCWNSEVNKSKSWTKEFNKSKSWTKEVKRQMLDTQVKLESVGGIWRSLLEARKDWTRKIG